MNILKNNHPLLNKVMVSIENPDITELQKTADDLFAFVDKNGGAGLAANQVGIDKRMFVVKYEDYKQAFINPQITWYSDRKLLLEEGCLTYPDLFMNVKRPDAIRMTFIDYEGNKQEEQLFMGVTNRIIQHEYDHMEGKFFWSHLSKVQLDRWNKKLKKTTLAA
jgi:peptide deformylase